MLTKNFAAFLYGCSYYNGTRNNRRFKIKDTVGTEYETPQMGYTNNFLQKFQTGFGSDAGTFWLALGNGSTPATSEDYTLENEIDTLVAGVGDYVVSNGKIRIYRTYANNTDSDIEVSEIGLVVRASIVSGVSAILLAREVFDSKIVVKPGGGTAVRHRHWIDTELNALHNLCSSPICEEVAA